jgi:hypothetical protein
MSILLLERLALSGRGYALFTRVRGMGILGSSLPVRHQCLKIRILRDTLLYLMGVRYIRIMDR